MIDRHSTAGKFSKPERRTELLVVGAGPAGVAAAITAARAGLSVMLVDENPVSPALMGTDVPLYYGGRMTAATQAQSRMMEQVFTASPGLAEAFDLEVDVQLATSVWGAWVPGPANRALSGPVAGFGTDAGSGVVGFERLILATGARDLVLSFAGAELPGVMGAQALHALLRCYNAFSGRRLVILGSGPLALQTATLALDHGLDVAALVDVGDATVADCSLLAARGVEIVTSAVPVAATGGIDGVCGFTLAIGDTRREIACDTICLAIGAVPCIELLDVLGADLAVRPGFGGHVPRLTGACTTSLAEVFVAGDISGLGLDATAHGVEAAHAVLRSLGRTASAPTLAEGEPGPDVFAVRTAWMRALLEAGGLDVVACLCEEVTRRDILGVRPPRYLGCAPGTTATRDLASLLRDGPVNHDQIKRLTRASMGACQARRCREQVAALLGLGAGVPLAEVPLAGHRAPVRPLPLAALADRAETADMQDGWTVWFGIPTQWITYDDIGTPAEAQALRDGMEL